MALSFKVLKRDGLARVGLLRTKNFEVETPLFMPVGTLGVVKALTNEQLWSLNYRVFLANTYHLYLRPGVEVIKRAGGLKNFISWKGGIITDSGGFQIYSLSRVGVKVKKEGVIFKDHLMGKEHFFSPEKVIEIQEIFNSDIIMPLDVCLEYQKDYQRTKWALNLTLHYLERSLKVKKKREQSLFGIVQGGFFEDLRRESARRTVEFNLDGYSIGGLSVGEPKEELKRMLEVVCEELPQEKPRYLMGVGKPSDLLLAISLGVDMFDCVIPTRSARTGTLYTYKGVINLRNSKHKEDLSPIEEDCNCYTCKNFSKAYLRHLLLSEELTFYTLSTIHNLFFFNRLMEDIRRAIKGGYFKEFFKEFYGRLEEKA